MEKRFKLFIHGKWLSSQSWDEIKNPYNGEIVGHVAQADQGQIKQAITSACSAFEETRHLSSHQRAEILAQIAQGLLTRREEISTMIVQEAGKPWQYASAEVERAISTFTIASEEALRINGDLIPADRTPSGDGYLMLTQRFPIGPISAITPFNFPLNLVAHKVAPAFATGNTVVLKPSPQAPLTALLLAEVVEQAGAPPGMLNVIPCGVQDAEQLVVDDRIKMLSFTGSAKVGWHLKEKTRKKKITLELGGNAAAIVHNDADLSGAAKRLAVGSFAYSGQVCISVQRIYVHESVYNAFLKEFLEAVRGIIPGDPMDPNTVVGPLIDSGAADRIEQWIQEAKNGGAKILAGGGRKQNIIEPTVLTDVTSELKVNCEEVFGPLVVITPYRTLDEAFTFVNDSPYGLQAGLFTFHIQNILDGFQNLDVGGLMINEYPSFRVDHMPYGGTKNSGLGREGVKYAMDEMTELKLLVIKNQERL